MLVLLLLLIVTPTGLCSIIVQTLIYIDTVPGYKNLSACAEYPVSTLIRDMWNGCGDDSQLTSYSCFCTDSYLKFMFDISPAIISSCGSAQTAQVASAVDLFERYCAIGVDHASLVTVTCRLSEIKSGGSHY